MNHCKKCNEWKDESEFYASRQRECKACSKARVNARYHVTHPEAPERIEKMPSEAERLRIRMEIDAEKYPHRLWA